VVALVFPAEVPSEPDVGPALAAAGLRDAALEGVALALLVAVRGPGADHAAEVDEVLLSGGALGVGVPDPLFCELSRVHPDQVRVEEHRRDRIRLGRCSWSVQTCSVR
jgi:hypothetical protein